jgi:predicted dehydrogenase
MADLVRWGILSTAGISRAFIRGVGRSRSSCVQAVASREWTRAHEWAKENGVPRAFGSYEELIASDEVDAIYNPLPNSMHAEWTIKALDAGKPVLCEKPFASNAAEAEQMAAAAKRNGVLLVEAFMYRHHPLYDQVRVLLDAGTIGTLVSMRAVMTLRLDDEHNIRKSPELAGGALMDVGCYCVNVCRLITGREPERVCAMEHRRNVDETFVALMEFPGEVLCQFECSMENNPCSRVDIVGTGGMLVLESPWYPGDEQGEFTLVHGRDREKILTPGADCFQLEVEDFALALRENRPARWLAEDSVANMRVIDALYESARTGKAVEVAGSAQAIRPC